MTPEEAEQLQRKYLAKRRRWMRKVGWPFTGHENPDPGELDADDPENG